MALQLIESLRLTVYHQGNCCDVEYLHVLIPQTNFGAMRNVIPRAQGCIQLSPMQIACALSFFFSSSSSSLFFFFFFLFLFFFIFCLSYSFYLILLSFFSPLPLFRLLFPSSPYSSFFWLCSLPLDVAVLFVVVVALSSSSSSSHSSSSSPSFSSSFPSPSSSLSSFSSLFSESIAHKYN